MVKELGKNEILEKLNMDNLYSVYYADTQEELENYIEEELGLFLEDSGNYWRGAGEYVYNGFTNELSTLEESIDYEYEVAIYQLECYDLETKKEILEHRYNEVKEIWIINLAKEEFNMIEEENKYYDFSLYDSLYYYLKDEGFLDKLKYDGYNLDYIGDTISTILRCDGVGELYYEVYAIVVK